MSRRKVWACFYLLLTKQVPTFNQSAAFVLFSIHYHLICIQVQVLIYVLLSNHRKMNYCTLTFLFYFKDEYVHACIFNQEYMCKKIIFEYQTKQFTKCKKNETLSKRPPFRIDKNCFNNMVFIMRYVNNDLSNGVTVKQGFLVSIYYAFGQETNNDVLVKMVHLADQGKCSTKSD